MASPQILSEVGLSVVIPTLNESKRIVQLLDSLIGLHQRDGSLEVVISDDGSTDGTQALVRQRMHLKRMGGQADQKDVCIKLVEKPEEVGSMRAKALNRGLDAATEEYVLFLHADSILPDDFAKRIQFSLVDKRVSVGGFPLAFFSEETGEENTFPVVAWHHWLKTYYPAVKNPRRFWTTGLRNLFGDQGMFGRRDQLLAIGGFDEVPVMEEYTLLLKSSDAYGRVALSPGRPIRTSDRRLRLYGTFRITLLHLWVAVGSSLGIPLAWMKRIYPSQDVVELRFLRSSLSTITSYETNSFWREIFFSRIYSYGKVEQGASWPELKACENSITRTSSSAGSCEERSHQHIVDVGANIGIASLWFDRYIVAESQRRQRVQQQPQAALHEPLQFTIHSFEPSSAVFSHLQRNLALVENCNAMAYRIALSSRSGCTKLRCFPRDTGQNTLCSDVPKDVPTSQECEAVGILGTMRRIWKTWMRNSYEEEVQVLTISDWMSKNHVETVMLLKVSVEKHEQQILEGIHDDDWRRIANIVVKCILDHEYITGLLQSKGFQVHVRKDADAPGGPRTYVYATR